MSTRTLTAAAIPIGAVVRIGGPGLRPGVTVARIVNGDPLPGWLTLTDETGRVWHLGGSERVALVSLP